MGSIIRYGQKGYDGSSMSNRARAAYEDGEMPKSKLTKSKMLEVMQEYCWEQDLDFTEPEMTKDELFEKFFEYKSWHHTSKFANVTYFYGLNENVMLETFPALTDEQLEALKIAQEKEWEKEREERERIKAKFEQEVAERNRYIQEHGYASDSVAAFMANHPEECTYFTSKKGNQCVRIRGHAIVLDKAKKTRFYGYDALEENKEESV